MNENNQKKNSIGEFLSFLNQTKKWWLLPIAVFVLLIAAVIILSVSGTSSFIYSIF